MIIVVTTFGFNNVIDNLVWLGPAAIPSWFAVGMIYFLPLALILVEFSSDNTEFHGCIFSFMARGLNPTWALVGTWSYFLANIVFLQSVFSRLPIRASLALTGLDIFEDVTRMSPIRAMFADVPRVAFPPWLTRSDERGTLHHALWTQATVSIVLILIPLLSMLAGLAGSEAFPTLLNDLAPLSLLVPYIFVTRAYIRARRNGMDAPFMIGNCSFRSFAL